jgi:hypothetical protein
LVFFVLVNTSLADAKNFFGRKKKKKKTFFSSFYFYPKPFVFLVLPRFLAGGAPSPHAAASTDGDAMSPAPVELPRLRMRHALLEAAPELAELLGESGSVGGGWSTGGGGGRGRKNASASVALRSPSPQGKRQAMDRRSSFDAEKTEEEQVVREREAEGEREGESERTRALLEALCGLLRLTPGTQK